MGRSESIISNMNSTCCFRFQLALGTSPYSTDLLPYTSVQATDEDIFFVDKLLLPPNAVFFTTLRIYNNAGLSSEISSESVVVSQNPSLYVQDGNEKEDIDFQSTPTLIQGSWRYSDSCPISDARWSVLNLSGKRLFESIAIPGAGRHFYNDEVQLENGKKYIVTVETLDFLGRIKKSQSDGVSIRIQPPYPGLVRDGLDKDINYQFETSELSANWENFGDKSNDPTQKIRRYEVAIGNDRRYFLTLSNVHYFVDVGLNTSHTFTQLNLKEKLRYYITVRAYSEAGSFVEGYSNGVRVGYDNEIDRGFISVKKISV